MIRAICTYPALHAGRPSRLAAPPCPPGRRMALTYRVYHQRLLRHGRIRPRSGATQSPPDDEGWHACDQARTEILHGHSSWHCISHLYVPPAHCRPAPPTPTGTAATSTTDQPIPPAPSRPSLRAPASAVTVTSLLRYCVPIAFVATSIAERSGVSDTTGDGVHVAAVALHMSFHIQ